MESYNKIIRQSNTLYNIGLEKAKVRDLSGAAQCLRKSLRFYKANTQARNLLGLIYFEMGETVDALSEWVISRSFQPEDNPAEQYLNSIQSNRNQLNAINQTIKKYNQALLYCQQGSQDLAIIQLKKVMSLNPQMVKAHQLLALLYMQEGRVEQAKKELRAAGRIDGNNTTTLRYLKEVNMQLHGEQPSQKNGRREKEETVAFQSGNETIIQPANLKDNSAVMTIINIIVGIIIGAAVTYFLILPGIKQNSDSDAKKAEVEANNTLATKNQEIKKLESNIAELEKQIEDMKGESQSSQTAVESYEKLLAAYNELAAQNIVSAGTYLSQVNQDLLSEASRAIYESVNAQVNQQYVGTVYQQAMQAYNTQDYQAAVTEFEKVVKIEEDYDDGNAIYYLAQSYRKIEDLPNAKKYYQKMVELHPNTARARTSQTYLEEMADVVVPPEGQDGNLPEDTGENPEDNTEGDGVNP